MYAKTLQSSASGLCERKHCADVINNTPKSLSTLVYQSAITIRGVPPAIDFTNNVLRITTRYTHPTVLTDLSFLSVVGQL